jgi:hypothetical protein
LAIPTAQSEKVKPFSQKSYCGVIENSLHKRMGKANGISAPIPIATINPKELAL